MSRWSASSGDELLVCCWCRAVRSSPAGRRADLAEQTLRRGPWRLAGSASVSPRFRLRLSRGVVVVSQGHSGWSSASVDPARRDRVLVSTVNVRTSLPGRRSVQFLVRLVADVVPVVQPRRRVADQLDIEKLVFYSYCPSRIVIAKINAGPGHRAARFLERRRG